MNVALTATPDHIPANLLRDIDPWQLLMSAGMDAHERASKFHQEFPRIFYATKLGFLGGVWLPRLAADIRNILQDTETFSSASYTGIAKMIGESWNLTKANATSMRNSHSYIRSRSSGGSWVGRWRWRRSFPIGPAL